jgi:hypothetical protein
VGQIGYLNTLLASISTPGSGDSSSTPASTAFVESEITRLTRKRLNANTTWYVSTTGSDSNDGLTSGAAWATIQHAWDTIKASYDLNGFVPTLQIVDGTYTQGLSATTPLWNCGGGGLIITGNATTPSNVVVNGQFSASAGATLKTQNFKHANAGAIALLSDVGGLITFQNIVFGASSYHLYANAGTIRVAGAYSISGNFGVHSYANSNGNIALTGATVTLTGTPAIATAFAQATFNATIIAAGMTFVGSATGQRYDVSYNAVINTSGGGASYFPGSTAGATSNGGLYS